MTTFTKPVFKTQTIVCLFLLSFFAIPSYGNLYINEINGNDKWLEVYNSDESPVDLSGYIIQKIDEDGLPIDWVVPTGTIISGKGFLTWTQDEFCVDGSTFTWGISAKKYVGFKLYTKNVVLLDFFNVNSFENLSDGGHRSIGRKTDGDSQLALFLDGGTKGTSNNAGILQTVTENPKKLFVNEISGNEKWFELYNDENEDIDLTDYRIQKINDQQFIDDTWKIPEGTIIKSKGFYTWTQDEFCVDGSTFTWGISAKKDVGIVLIDKNFTVTNAFMINSDLYSEGEEKTVGRRTDGADKLVIYANGGTKGTSNNSGTLYYTGIDTQQIATYPVYAASCILHLPENISSINIFNISGVLVLSGKTNGRETIDLNRFSKGIYVVRFLTPDNEWKSTKIILK